MKHRIRYLDTLEVGFHVGSDSAVINQRAVTKCEGATMRKLLLGIAMSLATVASASSADLYTKAPPPPPMWSWSGCYVAAGGGYGMKDIDHAVTNAAGT